MTLRTGLSVCVLVWGLAGVSLGQTSDTWRASPDAPAGQAGAVQPNQPVVPQNPTLQVRPQAQQPYGPQPYPTTSALQQGPAAAPAQPGVAAPGPAAVAPPQPPAAPFTLTPAEEAELDRALRDWEEKSGKVKTYSCKFVRLDFDVTIAAMLEQGKTIDPNKPTRESNGELKYAAPDKGLYRVDGKTQEKWICDGRAIYAYDFDNKIVTEYPLPAELQGKAIADGPLPFIFGASSAKLKQRYFLRLVTPANADKNQIWLQAFPRFQADAANFSRATLILADTEKMPIALELYMPNAKDRTVYTFQKPMVNNLFDVIQAGTFKPDLGWGWKKVVDNSGQTQRVTSQPGGAAPR